MNFSESWKSTWPVTAVFPAPNLLSGPAAKPLGPLLFAPSPSSPPLPLFSSPALALPPPLPLHPSSLRDALRAFLCDPREAFVPSSAHADLAAAVLPDHGGSTEEPFLTNQLRVLRCRDGATFVVFFPTGSNGDEVGFLSLSVKGAAPEIRAREGGEVFRQSEGFAHPRHRIVGMAVIPADPPDIDWDTSGDPAAEGYLLVTTLYSVNWFRVEIGPPGSGSAQGRPSLVPIGRRSFANRVVHACWNPHFQEESVVLLENGDLYWIKLNSKRGVRIRALEGDSSRWLGCQFGGQPWIVFVASSDAVVMVDLRSKNGSKRTVLARIEEPSPYEIVHSMEKDRFVAFCKADFDDFHFSVATEHHLFLFDTRQPLLPVLTWDHALDRPCYIAMYRLWELRPSTEFKWASESGFGILVGSFWNSEFSLFCCGPKAKGDALSYMLYAWELPSALSLLGRECNSADDLLTEEFSKEEVPGGTKWQPKDIVVGFCILPEIYFPMLSKSEDTGGFFLLRLLSSGRLEWQRYCASWELFRREPSYELETPSESQVSPVLFWDQGDRLATRHDYLKFNFLSAYLSGKLSNTLHSEMHSTESSHMESKQCYDNHEWLKHIDKELCKSSPSVSDCLNDVSTPMSIYEIASQRALFSLSPDLLHLAFSKYSELFTDSKDSSFELLEACSSLPYKRLPSIFIRKPSGRSEKWSHKALPTDCLVGPVLPLPVLLTLQQIEEKNHAICPDGRSNNDDLLSCQCRMILEGVFPEISIAADNAPSEHLLSHEMQDEKPFFIHEPRACASGAPIYHKTCSTMAQQKGHSAFPLESSETTVKEDKFSVFISGIRDKPDCKSSIQDTQTPEMFDDLTPMKLDIDTSGIEFSQNEQKLFSSLKRQFSKWQTQGF